MTINVNAPDTPRALTRADKLGAVLNGDPRLYLGGIGELLDMAAAAARGNVLLTSAYDIANDGTSQHTKWQQALNDAVSTGKTLIVDTPFLLACPSGSAFLECKVTNPAKLHIEGRSFISYDHKTVVLRIERTPEVQTSVTAQAVVAWPSGQSGNFVTRLTVASTTGFAPNRTVMVHSADLYAIDSVALGTDDVVGSEKAQLVEVMEVDAANSYIYLREILYETLTTNVRVALLRECDTEVSLKITASGNINDETLDVPDRARAAVVEDFGIGSRINVYAPLLRSEGIGVFGGFRSDYSVRGVKKARNNPTVGSYPYGVNVSGPSRFCETFFSGAGVRHGVTNTMRNSVASGELRKKGRQADISVRGIGWNTSSATWDTHPGALRWTFDNCRYRFPSLDYNAVAAGQTGTQVGFQDRGEGSTFINPQGDGNGLAFVLKSKLYTYGTNYHTTIINPVTRKLAAYSAAGLTNAWMSFAGIDAANTDRQDVIILGGSVRDQERLIEWHDYSSPVVPYGQNITITLGGGIRLHNVDKIEVGGNGSNATNLLIIAGVNRSYYSATTKTVERLYAYNNGRIRVLDYTLDLQGAADASAAIGAVGGGAADIFIGRITSNKITTSFVDVSITSGNVPAITYTKSAPLRGFKAYDPPSIPAGGSVTTTVTVTGLSVGGATACTLIPTFSADLQGVQMTAWLSANNTASVRFTNPTTGTIDPPPGTLMLSAERWT